MEVEFAYFHPHVGMRKCSKEKAIKMVENFLNDMKNGSGYDIAGRGFAIYCTQSPDEDGQMIYGRNDPDEFLSSLKESKITESSDGQYQFTLPFSDDEDLEYQRKVAKQLGLDFEFVDKSPEYMVFRGSKELLTKYCDTYGQDSKDIEKVK